MRHGERADDADPAWAPAADRPWDPPLTARGAAQARAAGEALGAAGLGITRVVTSPFLRCVQTTAQVLAGLAAAAERAGGGQPQPDVRVSIDCGLGEIMSPRAIRSPPSTRGRDDNDPAVWLAPLADLEALLPTDSLDRSVRPLLDQLPAFPEVEVMSHMRFANAFEAIADQFPNENILCISHGEGVSVSVSRLVPVTVYTVAYCGYSVTQRPIFLLHPELTQRPGGEWELVSQPETTGVSWIL
eukprot:SM000170S02658  [mRNA]  locus=s170:65371:66694:+ [translate_table: standard]